MVLPSSPVDDVPREGSFVDDIRRQLSRVSTGIIVLVDHACPERLRELVVEMLPDYPDLWVTPDVEDIARVPDGTTMVLAPRAEDADFLNLNRPIFSARRLKVVLWCDSKTTSVLATRAVDFFDWISHQHVCPSGVAMHGVLGLRAAEAANARCIWWTGSSLRKAFRLAFPGQTYLELDAREPFPTLVERVADENRWIVWRNVTPAYRTEIVGFVLAETNRTSRVIIDARQIGYERQPVLHGKTASLRHACEQLAKKRFRCPGRLAALVGLEPEAIDLLQWSDAREGDLDKILRAADDPGAALATFMDEDFACPPVLRAFVHDERFQQLWSSNIGEAFEDRNDRARYAVAIAEAALQQGSPAEAEALSRQAVEWAAPFVREDPDLYIEALSHLAKALIRMGGFFKAEETLRWAMHLAETSITRWSIRENLLALADTLLDALTRQGKYHEAEEEAERVIALMPDHESLLLVPIQKRLESIRALKLGLSEA